MQDLGQCDGIGWSRVSFSGSRPGQPRLCGHFRRIRYGEVLAEGRLGWIQAGSAGVKTKPYVVRNGVTCTMDPAVSSVER